MKRLFFGFIAFSIFLSFTATAFPQSKKRVAVMALQNLSGDPSLDYIGSGFGETITTKLSNVKELDMIERMQVVKLLQEQHFQISFGDEETAVKAGKLLGVQFVVIGSFQKAGARLKADSRLVNVETGKIDAADDVKGNYDDIFELQEELALKLAQSLSAPVSEQEKTEMGKKPTENLSAYEWFAKGVNFYEKFKYDEAISAFQKAAEIDTGYANAFYYLGHSYNQKGFWDKAIPVYEKALEIYETKGDDVFAASMYNNIGVMYRQKGDYGKAMEYYQKSLTIEQRRGEDLSTGTTYSNVGLIYKDKGDYVHAMEYFQKALTIKERAGDQLGVAKIYNNMGSMYFDKGEDDRAVEYFQKALKLEERTGDQPSMATTCYNLSKIYAKKGDYERTVEYLEKSVEITCRLGLPDCEEDKKILNEIKQSQ